MASLGHERVAQSMCGSGADPSDCDTAPLQGTRGHEELMELRGNGELQPYANEVPMRGREDGGLLRAREDEVSTELSACESAAHDAGNRVKHDDDDDASLG